MVINEACQVWIEQRIEEELAVPEPDRKSHRAIASEIAKEIDRIFEAKVKPETIRKRIDRIGTNVPPKATTESDSRIKVESKPNEIIKAEPRKHIPTGKPKGGKRKGAGKKSINKVNKYEQAMLKTHASFLEQVAIAKRNGWKYVSIEMIKKLLENIASLIEA